MPDRGRGAARAARHAYNSPAAGLSLGVLLTVSMAAGCISGRVLSGYPGYPFASFSIPQPEEPAFFQMQAGLEEEGYPLDYTDREAGLINTRPGPYSAKPVFLSVVVGQDRGRDGWSDVWIAGFEKTESGVRRINPLDEVLWSLVMDVSGRISRRFGGTAPVGPDEREAGELPE